MEKLIELLNECTNGRFKSEDDLRLCIEMRWYCRDFIKWLVNNDKINLWKIKKLYRKSNENSTHTYPILYDYSYDESLLMFLAIQDEPIEFLISILKNV